MFLTKRRFPGAEDVDPYEHMDDPYEGCEPCPDPDCDGVMATFVEKNYGADADGRRGIDKRYTECTLCGEGGG